MTREKIVSFYKKYNLLIRYVLVFGFIFLYGLERNIMETDYWHDSLLYYKASQTFISEGQFSLLSYVDSLRGYFFPFLLYLFTALGDMAGIRHGMAILAANSLMAAFVFAVVLPSLFQNTKRHIVYSLISVLVFLIYWQDLIYYPLSDFFAFAMILLAVYFWGKALDCKGIYKYILYILSGMGLYGAYNTRTIYLFAGPFLLLLFVFFNRKNIRMILSGLICILVGILICGIPQSMINQELYGSRSLLVNTSNMEGGSLFNFQLTSGITMQRYETYVGSEDGYPKPKFIFEDEAGKEIMRQEGKELLYSVGEYLEIVMKYPLDFIGIYTRHLINALCTPYNHVYVKYLHAFKPWLILINYTLLFMAGLAIAVQKSYKLNIKKKTDESYFYLIFSLIPCLLILPGAIEMRFFAPFYILIYGYLAYKTDYRQLYTYVKKHLLKVGSAYAVILCVFLSVWGNTLAAAECGAQLFR